MKRMKLSSFVVAGALLLLPAALGGQRAADPPLVVDHYVPVRSSVPAIAGETVQLYVRERVKAEVLEGVAPSAGVVVFVHGAGTPGEVAFDAQHEDYSWMAYLAGAGFDVFSVEMTGYGRSTRPAPMNDPCNLPEARQAALAPIPLPSPCTPSYPHRLTTAQSDWDDIGAAVDYVRALRDVERVSLIGWSQGGPRAGGYAARHPEKVDRLVLLAPAYGRSSALAPPAMPTGNAPMGTQTLEEFRNNLERQAPCEGQLDPALVPVLWSEMLGTDPVAATWGPGMRRAPQTVSWGWNAEVVATVRAPTLLVAGVHDAQVSPTRVRELHEDLGSADKVFVDLGCASHAAMWEKNRLLLFGASLEWLTRGTVDGTRTGVVRLGY
jgi:pimeloyl-ACP methyl ester carboxylesterase